ncbi:MAG TPA: YbgC/FadM family acyl-CoA thioesterase [Candidatus Omnitrophota bacterium]|nr:YbgC/FadM family acyl-CoA thioesterase [Candidatus Omnitrophota bacterium]HPB69055.1 YbgC/FadM family acyl-CoA thioesterase [Candidatus Omnitrophota bacterium]HQO58096.1 YbgC/FadM family acyl-CoA thioesterase [Candidatus Omnitrophota bacterium]
MEKRIFFHDTDSGGIVYYGNYLKYLEEARTEFLEQKGLSVDFFYQQGFMYAVRKVTISYKSPAKYGDILCCDAALMKVTAAQIFFSQKISQKDTGTLVVDAEVVLACLNQNFRPVPIPEDLKTLLLK